MKLFIVNLSFGRRMPIFSIYWTNSFKWKNLYLLRCLKNWLHLRRPLTGEDYKELGATLAWGYRIWTVHPRRRALGERERSGIVHTRWECLINSTCSSGVLENEISIKAMTFLSWMDLRLGRNHLTFNRDQLGDWGDFSTKFLLRINHSRCFFFLRSRTTLLFVSLMHEYIIWYTMTANFWIFFSLSLSYRRRTSFGTPYRPESFSIIVHYSQSGRHFPIHVLRRQQPSMWVGESNIAAFSCCFLSE